MKRFLPFRPVKGFRPRLVLLFLPLFLMTFSPAPLRAENEVTSKNFLNLVFPHSLRLSKPESLAPRERELLDPANATNLSEAEISDLHPQSIQGILRKSEGTVFFDAVGNGNDETFSLRGFNQGNAVIFLVDGVRVNEVDGNGVTYPLIRTHGLEAVTIERGSYSHIYGDGAFAGVVKIQTGRPSEKPVKVFGGAEVSSHKGMRFNQGLSGTLQDHWTSIGGALQYYFNGGRDLSRGFRGNGESRITDFDIKVGYKLPEERAHLELQVKHVDDAISNPGELTLAQYVADPKQTNKPLDGRKYRNTIASLDGDAQFWDGRLRFASLISLRTNLIQFYSTSGTFTDFTTGSNPDTDFVSQKSRQTDYVWEASYQDEWENVSHRTSLGFELRDANDFSIEKDAFGGNILSSALVETERNVEVDNLGLFWRFDNEVFERLRFHFGMRHDFHSLQSTDRVTPTDSISRRWRKSTLSTGLVMRLPQNSEIFANFSQGFRVPNISDIAPFSGTVSQGLEPEESDSYEIGFRSKLKEKLNFTSSFFVIDLKDEIVFDSTTVGPSAPFGQNVNIGLSRRVGVETRLDWQALPELNLFGTYTWMQAWNRNTNPSGSIPDGRSLGQIPENRASWGFTAKPLARLETPFSKLRLDLSGSYTGKQHPQAYETTSQATLDALGEPGHWLKSFTVWDFQMALPMKNWELYFQVKNLFDHDYYSRAVGATSFGTAIYPAGTFTFVNPGAPRAFYLGCAWQFGE